MSNHQRPISPSTLIFLSFLSAATPSSAQDDWIAKKCALFTKAWSGLASPHTSANLSLDFRTAGQNFIASGCNQKIVVCPRSSAEIEIADMLTIILVNEGAASTFLPFACTDE